MKAKTLLIVGAVGLGVAGLIYYTTQRGETVPSGGGSSSSGSGASNIFGWAAFVAALGGATSSVVDSWRGNDDQGVDEGTGPSGGSDRERTYAESGYV